MQTVTNILPLQQHWVILDIYTKRVWIVTYKGADVSITAINDVFETCYSFEDDKAAINETSVLFLRF